MYWSIIQVSEKDQAAIRTAYLAKHPNAFWVCFSSPCMLCPFRWMLSLICLDRELRICFYSEGGLRWLPIYAHWTKCCEICIRCCNSFVGIRRFVLWLLFCITSYISSILMIILNNINAAYHLRQGTTGSFSAAFYPFHLLFSATLMGLFVVLLFLSANNHFLYFVFPYVILYFFICLEFRKEEYQDSKVDPIAQFSKPVAVFFFFCSFSLVQHFICSWKHPFLSLLIQHFVSVSHE